MKLKITFKKDPRETGLRSVGNPRPNTTIKLNGLEIGYLDAPNWQTEDHKWGIRLMVNDSTYKNCDWKWISLKARTQTEPDARVVALKAIPLLSKKYTFHSHSD